MSDILSSLLFAEIDKLKYISPYRVPGDSMGIWQGRSLRKPSGGRIKFARKKKKYEIGRDPVLTHIGEDRRKIIRVMGGNTKIKLLRGEKINVYNPKTGKSEVSEILNVLENPSNPHFAQRNIITKGEIVETPLGKVKITSRPGQHGVLNGVLIE